MKVPLKILILENKEDDSQQVQLILKKRKISFTMHRVHGKDEYIQGLKDFKPDIILSNHMLPQFNAMEALHICQRIGITIPFILVTDAVSEEFAVTCLKNGADNYVLKGNLSRLPSAIANALQQKEDEKNRKLAERSLHKQNQMLIKVNQELDKFVYSTSHNLRSPLMSILGLLNISRKEVQNIDISRMTDYFNMMEESINKLDNTLKEIVDYSKNSRIEVKIDKVNLDSLLKNCINQLKYLDGADQLLIDITFDGSQTIRCDAYRLNIIFTNLISNSISFRDVNKDKNKLTISVHTTSSKTTIRLKDNGIGIVQDYIDKVFEMFYRASEKSNGSGLGLYIVKETVDRLLGKISIDSTIGVGTTVDVEMPYGYKRQ